MKKTVKKVIGLVLAGVLTAGLAGCADTAQNSEAVSGHVSLNGSTSMKKLVEAMCEEFNAADTGVTAEGQYTGSGAGLEAVAAGTSDIGDSSRALKDEEKAKGLVENIVAIDGIAVIANKGCTTDDLTAEQLAKIFTGEITNWSELSGSDGKIVVIGRENGSGTRDAFEEMLSVKEKCAYAQELDQTGAVLTTVASTANAIGYISLDVLNDTVKAVKINGTMPTAENIKAGTYKLQRPFVMATKGAIDAQNPAVQKFFEFVKSDAGKKIIESTGLIIAD